MADTVATVRVGPEDNGRRMSFAEFQRAEGQDGHRYELAAGVIEVTDVPGRTHARILYEIERQLHAYNLGRPGVIQHMAGSGAAKTELPEMESERHPDLSIYLTPMPDDEYPWDKWAPGIAVEIVSPGAAARKRDYVAKRKEYLAAGMLEYWIVDPNDQRMLALTRHGDTWREHALAADGQWATPLLPGFVLRLGTVFGGDSGEKPWEV